MPPEKRFLIPAYQRFPVALWENGLQTVTVKGKAEPIRVWALTFAELDGVLPKLAAGT